MHEQRHPHDLPDASPGARKYELAVNRLRTAFHGYLRELASVHSISFSESDSISSLYNKLHAEYESCIKPQDVATRIRTILRSRADMVSAINEIRNSSRGVRQDLSPSSLVRWRSTWRRLRWRTERRDLRHNRLHQMLVFSTIPHFDHPLGRRYHFGAENVQNYAV